MADAAEDSGKRKAEDEADTQPAEKKAVKAEGGAVDDTPRQKWGVLLQRVMLVLYKKHGTEKGPVKVRRTRTATEPRGLHTSHPRARAAAVQCAQWTAAYVARSPTPTAPAAAPQKWDLVRMKMCPLSQLEVEMARLMEDGAWSGVRRRRPQRSQRARARVLGVLLGVRPARSVLHTRRATPWRAH